MPGSVVLPGRGDVHVDRPLTKISIAYKQRVSAFVASDVFPTIPVTHKSDSFYVYPKDAWFRDEAQVRGAGTPSAGGGYDLDTDTYNCVPYAFHKDIEDQVRENYDAPLDPETEATNFVTQKFLLRRERDWASKHFVTSVWTGGDVDGVASGAGSGAGGIPGANQFLQWSDDNSTPVQDVRSAKRVVLGKTGFMPNVMVLGRETFDALVDHPDVVGRFDRGQTTGVAVATMQTLATLFELEAVYVMDSIVNTAAQGQTASMGFVGGKKALLAFRNPTPGLMMPSAGYTFAWTGRYGATRDGFRIKRFRMEENEADRVEINFAFDHKRIGADLGYFFDTAVA